MEIPHDTVLPELAAQHGVAMADDATSVHPSPGLSAAAIGDTSGTTPVWHRLLAPQATGTAWRRVRWLGLREYRWDLDGLQHQIAELAALEGHAIEALSWHWQVDAEQTADDGSSIKWRFSTADGRAIETVLLLPVRRRATVCVSSQVGCQVGCVFCATGRMRPVRQLSASEILEQVFRAGLRARAMQRPVRNVVFMGMGEPLQNAEAVSEAIDWLVDDTGFGLSPRHITVSSVGVPSKMCALARRFPRLRLALSLHSAVPHSRNRLVPGATSDIEALKALVAELNQLQGEGPVWLQYVLLGGINDDADHAAALIDFCRTLRVEINVIPWNPIDDEGHAPRLAPSDRQHQFVAALRAAGLFTTVRKSLGASIEAACGQLAGVKPSGALAGVKPLGAHGL